MHTRRSMAMTQKELRAFTVQNPGFDLLGFDFHDATALAGLRFDGADADTSLARLRARQRVLRLTGSDQVADKLLAAGLHSAHQIGGMSQARFVREHGALFADAEWARQVHAKAVTILAKAQHVWANVRDLVGSQHFRATRFYNAHDSLVDYFQQIPSYQDLFGGLDYLTCPHCRSIFSPAAYFVDLMRITDEYVTYPNTHKESENIPDGLKLEDRRPDLFTLPLTCANVDTKVSYLEIVNKVLEGKLEQELAGDVFQALALAPYPFNLPFHLPLTQIRRYLTALKTNLAQVFATMSDPSDGVDVAREQLGLSVEQYQMLTTTAGTPTEVAKMWGYQDLTDVLPPFGDGAGLITIANGSTAVAGNSDTRFDTQLSAGDQIWCGDQIRSVASIAGPASLTVDRLWDAGLPNASYRIARWRAGAGTITIKKDGTIVTGDAGARFERLTSGDQIQCAGVIRTIATVRSAAELLVDSPFGVDATNARYTENPASDLARLTTFLDRTGLTRKDVDELFRQGTGGREFDAGVTQRFFVNATGEGLPPLRLITDRGDPANRFERIAGLSVRRLDRLSRFIRLATALRWTAADTDWLLNSIGATEIDGRAIEALAVATRLTASTSLPVEAVTSFWHDLKTIGRGDEASPDDLFDRVYNAPALLRGQDPYTSPEPIPFDPARPLTWQIDERTEGSDGATIRSRLTGALGIGDDDLTAAARYVGALQGQADGTLVLDLATLTWLYRLVRQAAWSQLAIDEYFRLLWLLFYPQQRDPLPPPPNSVPNDIAASGLIGAAAQWLLAAPLNAYQLQYVITGKESAYFKAPFTTADLRGLIGSLAGAAAGVRLGPGSFVAGDIRPAEAADLFDDLVELGLVTPIGIATDSQLDYAKLASLFPLTRESFVTTDIDPGQSAQAFTALASHLPPYIIASEGATTGTLSEEFTPDARLDFLFPDDPDRTQKQGQVREVLLSVRANIGTVTAVLAQATKAQEDQAEQGVAEFLGIGRELLTTSLDFCAGQRHLAPQRVGLLTSLPAGDPVPPGVHEVLTALARCGLWTGALGFTAAQVAAVTANPAPFGIADTKAIGFAEIRTLAAFGHLTVTLNDVNGVLFQYFAKPGPDGLALLADLTGWNFEQLTRLMESFWPEGSREQESRTVAGVDRFEAAFALAEATGTDAFFLADLLDLSHLPVGVVGGEIDSEAWATYERAAGRTLDALSGRFSDSFTDVYAQVRGDIETAKRDAMVGHTIWLLRPEFPDIVTPNDVYQFLLIDVEMSDCAITTPIAQAIGSLQLYLQRCRMSLEPYVTELDVDPDWWSWLSTYRLWEANRKIFLYPENYIQPQLRSSQSPEFGRLADSLLQADLSEGSVTGAYLKYFDEVDGLAGMIPVASHNADVAEASGDSAASRLFVVSRARTDPYVYYWRSHDDTESWSPWQKVDLSITSPEIAATYAFERLFLFWAEQDTGKTSTIVNAGASARYLRTASVRYSFLGASGQWVQPQVLASAVPTEVDPDEYGLLKQPPIMAALTPSGLYWRQPYPFRLARGLAGTGRVEITNGKAIVSGNGTMFRVQVRAGDRISVGSQVREVSVVADDGNLSVAMPWTRSARNAEFKVIPARTDVVTFAPFNGTGLISFSNGSTFADGTGTQFGTQVTAGDRLLVANQIRTVVEIKPDGGRLVVDKPWSGTYQAQPYLVMPAATGGERLVVMFGGTLSAAGAINPQPPPPDNNPGRDPFIQRREAFDRGVYYSALLHDKKPIALARSQVTLNYSAVLDADLQVRDTRALVTDYGYSAGDNPRPYQYRLDHGARVLQVAQNDNAVVDNYWGNNAPGTPQQPAVPVGKVNTLLYNISPRPSLRNVGNQIGWTIFDNVDESFLVKSTERGLARLSNIVVADQIQEDEYGVALVLSAGAYTDSQETPFDDLSFKFIRLTTNVITRLRQRLLVGGIGRLLTLDSQTLPELPFNRFYATPDAGPPRGVTPPEELLDFNGSYGLYFKEMFLFCPWLVADRLQNEQRFDDAQKWYEYIFNPTAKPSGTETHPHDRYWRYLPFRSLSLDSLLANLTDPAQIAAYNNHPFDPDAIAWLRPAAYPKAIVLDYIDNLLNWGDYLFGLDTSESINEATQLYVLAADLLGPRPTQVGVCPVPPAQNFGDIRAKYGQDIPQFLIDLENGLPGLMNSPEAIRAVPINDIRAYFCVPENSDLITYWDKVDDRLFKIRHCMNLQGVVRQLPVFEPPIGQGQLARARAADRGAAAAVGQVSGPPPFYRFVVTIERAKAFAGTVIALGSELLGALERQDAEHLALLRTTQESALLDLTVQLKRQQVQQVIDTGTALAAARAGAQARRDHYQRLIDSELSPEELVNLAALEAALVYNVLAGVARTASSIAYTIPQIGSPFAITYGGVQVGSALAAGAAVFEIGSMIAQYNAQKSLTMAGYQRRAQDWEVQRMMADYDEQAAQAQINANNAAVQAAQRDLDLTLTTIAQNRELASFLLRKFTSEQLYQWMAGRLSEVYFQSWLLALELARSAERALAYELNISRTFLDSVYWDNAKKGLLAGESLTLALAQMEKAYADGYSRTLEIEKTISLAQLNPRALLDLKATGTCVFHLSERLFDFDFPGHYCRRLKTIAVTIPAIIGPYQTMHVTLTQLSDATVLQPKIEPIKYLLGSTTSVPSPELLRTNIWVSQQVALSRGVNDAGVFTLDFGDPRYLPFEGTGAISTWQLSMPPQTNRFDFATISDVLLTVSYTAKDGGTSLRRQVVAQPELKDHVGSPLLSLAQLYSQDWYAFMTDHSDHAAQTLRFKVRRAIVPPHLESPELIGFFFQLITADGGLAATAAPYVGFWVTDGVEVRFAPDQKGSYAHSFAQPVDMSGVFDGDRAISFALADTPAELIKDGFLNPAVVHNIALVLYYRATVRWQ
jgi:hypothetical protein